MSRLVLTLFVVAGMMFSVCSAQSKLPEFQKTLIFTNQKIRDGWPTSMMPMHNPKNRKTHHGQLYLVSDWCGWCKNFTASVFLTLNSKHGAEKMWFCWADFPEGKIFLKTSRQQNANLQQAFQVMGYPTVWVFDLDKMIKDNNYSGVHWQNRLPSGWPQVEQTANNRKTVITIIKITKVGCFIPFFLCEPVLMDKRGIWIKNAAGMKAAVLNYGATIVICGCWSKGNLYDVMLAMKMQKRKKLINLYF